jgi:hypothetical protein
MMIPTEVGVIQDDPNGEDYAEGLNSLGRVLILC